MDPSQIELAAVLNLVPYLDINFNYSEEVSLERIISDNESRLSGDETFEIFKAAVQQNSYGEVILVNQSRTNSTDNWTDDLIQGCTFKDPDGNYYVSFRGTGEKRWIDNGDGMTAASTVMQEAAVEYFDEMAEKYFIDAHENGKQIIVTGHSKGGNEAQFVYMSSDYEYLIDKCYSFDGQGFSKAAVENFQERYGDNYSKKISDMYSICGQEDYVNGFGIIIVPEDNIYFVETTGSGFKSYHELEKMIGEKGTYIGLQWATENGEIINGEQGEIGKFARALTERMMRLDDENLNGIAIAIMSIMDSDSLTDVNVKWTDYVDLLAHGVPIALETLILTEEGRDLIKEVAGDWFKKLYDEHGVFGVIGGVVVGSFLLITITPIVLGVVQIAKIVDKLIDVAEKIVEFYGELKEFVSDVKEFVVKTVKNIIKKIKSLSSGYKYASNNPKIVLDTYKLKNYAQRLKSANIRITSIDKRLDSLYWKVGLLDLWNLMQADVLTGYSKRLSKCATYLTETASDFESAEKEIKNNI